jgi:hypothetical protein
VRHSANTNDLITSLQRDEIQHRSRRPQVFQVAPSMVVRHVQPDTENQDDHRQKMDNVIFHWCISSATDHSRARSDAASPSVSATSPAHWSAQSRWRRDTCASVRCNTTVVSITPAVRLGDPARGSASLTGAKLTQLHPSQLTGRHDERDHLVDNNASQARRLRGMPALLRKRSLSTIARRWRHRKLPLQAAGQRATMP